MKNVWSCSSAKSSESAHPLFFDFWVWVDPNHKENRKQRWSRHRERSFWNLALKCKSSQSLEQSQSAYTLWGNLKGLENHCMMPWDAGVFCLFLFPRSCSRVIWLLRNCHQVPLSLQSLLKQPEKTTGNVNAQFSSVALLLFCMQLSSFGGMAPVLIVFPIFIVRNKAGIVQQ